jgi:hypothetical protein
MQGGGEWKLTSTTTSEHTGTHEYWECTDGRTLQYDSACEDEPGVKIPAEYITRDQYGNIGKYKTMEEAHAAVRQHIPGCRKTDAAAFKTRCSMSSCTTRGGLTPPPS